MRSDRSDGSDLTESTSYLFQTVSCKELLNTIDIPISIHDDEFKIVFMNRAMKKHLDSDARGRRCFEVIHNQDSPPVGCPLEKTIFSGEICRGEVCIDSQGRQAVVTTAPFTLNSGQKLAIHIIHDITEQKNLERDLLQQKTISEFILEKSPLGIAFSQDRKIIRVNEAFEKMSGYARDELIGRDSRHLYPNRKLYEKIANQVYDFLKENELCTIPGMLKRKDGSLLPIKANIKKIQKFSLDGNNPWKEAYIWTIEDLTREKEKEQERKGIEKAHLRTQRLEALGLLASGIAHDFNNILTPIIGYIELAQAATSDEHLKGYLKTVAAASFRAKELVENLLRFSRGDRRKKEKLYLHKQLAEHVKLIRGMIPSSVIVKTDIREISAPIKADAAELNEIMMNFCTNAIHAMDEKGDLTIGCREIEIGNSISKKWPAAKPGKYAEVWVSDTGCGMDKRTLDRIFDPYFTTKGPEKGTGLGLAMVFRAVHDNSGHIHVDSVPGQGTTFRVIFPLVQANHNGENNNGNIFWAGSNSSLKGMKILLVDDEESILMLANEFLTMKGAEVTATANPKNALELLKKMEAPPDLLITDLTMPHMTGDQLASSARALFPALPVIIITGYGHQIEAVQHDYLMVKKPFKMSELIEAIETIMIQTQPKKRAESP